MQTGRSKCDRSATIVLIRYHDFESLLAFALSHVSIQAVISGGNGFRSGLV